MQQKIKIPVHKRAGYNIPDILSGFYCITFQRWYAHESGCVCVRGAKKGKRENVKVKPEVKTKSKSRIDQRGENEYFFPSLTALCKKCNFVIIDVG